MHWALRVGAAALVMLPSVMLWSARRHTRPILKGLEQRAPVDDLAGTLAGVGLGSALAGNAAQLLENGSFFDVLIERIGAARQTVHFETYLWKPGALSDRLVAALCERARAGVEVRVLADAWGARRMAPQVPRRLRAAGVRLTWFHPLGVYTLGVFSDRDHRKLTVIDGREAFVGGHCITDEWLGDAQDVQHFADVSVHLRGPIVHSVQACFAENWGAATGEILLGEGIYPPLAPAGELTMHAAFVKPHGWAPAVKALHHAAICLARERLWIQNPYFLPKPEAIVALGRAVERGVDVRVLTPSASASDNPAVQHASHRNFANLLRRGVRIFEYPHTLLHQKLLSVDRRWCAVGSSNFDDRSFDTNDELVIGIEDEKTTARVDEIFLKYARDAREVDPRAWSRRGPLERARDQAWYLLNEVL